MHLSKTACGFPRSIFLSSFINTERNRDIGWQFGQALIPRDTDYIIFEVRLPVPTTGVLDDRADVAIDDVWISQGSCNAGGETLSLMLKLYMF